MNFPKEFKLVIECPTFNHSDYLNDTFTGFSSQETTFPVVYVIVDDCSIDGSQSVILKYIDENCVSKDDSLPKIEETGDYVKVYARHLKNKNCYFIFFLLKYNHYQAKKTKRPYFENAIFAQYRGMCEGDDYWTYSGKLQKQVDYLDGNPNVNIYVHNADKIFCSTGEKVLFNEYLAPGIYTIKDVIGMKWFTPTASFVFRNNYVLSPAWINNGCNGDMAILYSNLLKGDLYYDDAVMSVYRYGTPSSLSVLSNTKTILSKKVRLYKTLNKMSNNRFLLYTLPQILKLRIKMSCFYSLYNSIRQSKKIELL